MKKTAYDFLLEAEEHLRRDNLQEALNLATERLRGVPTDAAALGIYCDALIGMGRIEDARKVLQEVPKIIDGLNLVFERAGDACREKGLHREAATCYEKFLSLRPDTERAREIIGKMAFLEQEDIVTAENEVPGNENNSAEKEFFTVTMAQLYIQQGHFEDAEAVLEKIIKKEPNNVEAINMLDKMKFSRLSLSDGVKKISAENNLLNILSCWLKNIERLKSNAAKK
ncbi:MAG TPA: tetratricopeptide repeat protein [Smithella sp.]|nr:tetratricopeptide repeat protein [Smithella sp.]MDM7986979.1 tetratricopeptide repeat protein [Smithella sp.]HNY51255.1 tetratricopeptide repeat protein [Smithella sp.]HOG91053.1 tetratricopeptide repeat protein [Smithella sp.]HOU51625.1 tetratricopeptide repeat protein [Smithella sp.]